VPGVGHLIGRGAAEPQLAEVRLVEIQDIAATRLDLHRVLGQMSREHVVRHGDHDAPACLISQQ
jgi:hypothetical protein